MNKLTVLLVFVIVAAASFGSAYALDFDTTGLDKEQIILVFGTGIGIAIIRAWWGYEKAKENFDLIKFIQTVKYYAIATIPAIAAVAVEQQATGNFSIITFLFAVGSISGLGEFIRVGVKKTVLSNEVVPEPAKIEQAKAEIKPASNWTGPGEAPNDVSDLHYDQLKANVNNEGRIYQNNFVQGQDGNKLPFGTNLKIKIDDASLVSGRLSKLTANGPMALQIDQSNAPNNPWPDMVKFEMLDWNNKKPTPMERGKYSVEVWYVRNGREGTFTDNFEIQ